MSATTPDQEQLAVEAAREFAKTRLDDLLTNATLLQKERGAHFQAARIGMDEARAGFLAGAAWQKVLDRRAESGAPGIPFKYETRLSVPNDFDEKPDESKA